MRLGKPELSVNFEAQNTPSVISPNVPSKMVFLFCSGIFYLAKGTEMLGSIYLALLGSHGANRPLITEF